jgi:hypothetical protein
VKLEVVVIGVSDVDRAKAFYEKLEPLAPPSFDRLRSTAILAMELTSLLLPGVKCCYAESPAMTPL